MEDSDIKESAEEFRFRKKTLAAIAGAVCAAGLLLVVLIWEAALRMGLFTEPPPGADRSHVPGNVMLVALILVGTFLLTAGVVVLFAEIKSVKVTAVQTEEPPVAQTEDAGAVLGAKLIDATATGLGKLKGGAVAVFGGVILFVLACWIITVDMEAPAEVADGPSSNQEVP